MRKNQRRRRVARYRRLKQQAWTRRACRVKTSQGFNAILDEIYHSYVGRRFMRVAHSIMSVRLLDAFTYLHQK